jgi:ATP-dependent Clp protease ATP-binding subunit ClpC
MIYKQELLSEEMIKVLKLIEDEILKQFPTYTITVDYIMYGILCSKKCDAFQLLEDLTTTNSLERVQVIINSMLSTACTTKNLFILNPRKKIEYEKDVKKIIENAEVECMDLKEEKITSTHILLSVLKFTSPIKRSFSEIAINYKIVHDRIVSRKREKENTSLLPAPNMNSLMLMATPQQGNMSIQFVQSPNMPKRKNVNIETFTHNLNVLYHQKKTDKIVGRDEEMNMIFQVLLKRNKNNVILTGETGCGITSMVYLMVERIINGKCPLSFNNKEIVEINFSAMLSGSAYRGVFEERANNLIREMKDTKNKYIAFIDDIHLYLSQDSNNSEVLNFINALLNEDQIQVICTVPIKSYKKNIEKNAFIEKHLNKIIIEKTSVEDTIQILTSNKHYYEDFHNVIFSDEIIEKTVKLTDKYINNKVLPSSALEVMDIMGASYSVNPNEDKDVVILKEEINELSNKMNECVDEENYEMAEQYKVAMNKKNIKLEDLRDKNKVVSKKAEVNENDLLNIVSKMTKIPLTTLSSNQLKRLSQIAGEIKEVVIGQDDAVDKVCKTIQKNRLGLKTNLKQPPVFMFLGNTGVGKTYLTRQIARVVFGDEKNMMRIDCSELVEEHSISKILGSPAGFVGYGQDTILDKVKHNPYIVVLIDEIEKAHPNIYNMFLQMFDEGRITDATGITIDFSNTVIIMTSNVGTKVANDYKPVGFGTPQSTDMENAREGIIKKQLKNKFSPEFLNRITSIIFFKTLSEDNLKKIIDLNLSSLNKVLGERKEKYSIKWNKDVVDIIYSKLKEEDKQLGARPILRLIENMIEENLTELLIENEYKTGYCFKLSVKDEELKIK